MDGDRRVSTTRLPNKLVDCCWQHRRLQQRIMWRKGGAVVPNGWWTGLKVRCVMT